MALVQQPAPKTNAQAVLPSGGFSELQLSDYRDEYVLLFFYPLDFTFVCPAEVIAFSDRIQEFEQRNVQVLGVSVDSHYSHLAWRNTPRGAGGIGEIRYPLISDLNKSISEQYGVLLPEGVALRGLFLIDRNDIVRHQVVSGLPLGRSVDEALRVIDALQFYEVNGAVCPANWQRGATTIKPTPDGSRPYFRSEHVDVTSPLTRN